MKKLLIAIFTITLLFSVNAEAQISKITFKIDEVEYGNINHIVYEDYEMDGKAIPHVTKFVLTNNELIHVFDDESETKYSFDNDYLKLDKGNLKFAVIGEDNQSYIFNYFAEDDYMMFYYDDGHGGMNRLTKFYIDKKSYSRREKQTWFGKILKFN